MGNSAAGLPKERVRHEVTRKLEVSNGGSALYRIIVCLQF